MSVDKNQNVRLESWDFGLEVVVLFLVVRFTGPGYGAHYLVLVALV